jgi:hypothetical protein
MPGSITEDHEGVQIQIQWDTGRKWNQRAVLHTAKQYNSITKINRTKEQTRVHVYLLSVIQRTDNTIARRNMITEQTRMSKMTTPRT